MGVRILHDERARVAALYCSTSGFAFGPLFEDDRLGHDGKDRAEAFLRWLGTYTPPHNDLNILGRGRWRHDPRELTDAGHEAAFSAWLAQEHEQYRREEAERAARWA